MNIIVTGCAGFIGSRVSELLLNDGHRIIGFDNLCDSYDVRLKKHRIDKLNLLEKFSFTECDISDRDKLFSFFSETGVKIDSVVNLAARAGVRYSIENPWVYYTTNVIGTLNLLELCKSNGIKKFVQASTSSVYGENELPFREDQVTDRQLSPYASSKKSAEGLCYTYHKNFDLDISVLRYFTVYGPGGRPDMSVFRFVKWIAEGSEVVFYGDGRQERDFTYVDDIARGTVLALKRVGFEVINLGSGNPISLIDIVNMIKMNIKNEISIIKQDAHPADIDKTLADITKADRLLGWKPETGLREGIENTINWYRSNSDLVKAIEV